LTKFAPLEAIAATRDDCVELLPEPTEQWLGGMALSRRWTDAESLTYSQIIGSIAIPTMFAIFWEGDEIAALAYGALQNDLLCYESVFTNDQHRGRGYARRTLAALASWAKHRGAKGACLQVEATNEAAQALYRSVGLKQELYRYHYRRQPLSN
jgi:predicted GNAT family acetyltransferase